MLIKGLYLPHFSTYLPLYELTPLQQPLFDTYHPQFLKIVSTKIKLSLVLVSYCFILESIYSLFIFLKCALHFSYSYQKSFLTQTIPSSGLIILHQFYLQKHFIKALSVMI